MTKKLELKPCPFCEEKANLFQAVNLSVPKQHRESFFYIHHYCSFLGHITTCALENKAKIIKIWNKRGEK